MKIFDTHVHYDDKAFDADRDDVLCNLKNKSVKNVTNIGCNVETSENTVNLTKKYEFMYGAVGIIPEECGNTTKEDLEKIRQMAKENKKIVAIGEIGLDYHYEDGPSKNVQQHIFREQINIARELGLPIVIHSRDAAEDTIKLMHEEKADETGGVMHCYSYTWETAKILLKMGFYFGVGGVVTFKNSKKLKNVVENISLQNIVLETDGPYLAPEPKRGSRNDSGNLIYVVKKIAEIKGISEDEVAETTFQNAKKLYNIN